MKTMEIGQYQVLGELGRTSAGVVYRAFDPVLRRPVAIKSTSLCEFTDPAERQAFWERLARDVRTASTLIHPNIVAVYDLFGNGGIAYIVMELVNGPSLAKLLGRNVRVNQAVLLRTLEQAAAGLDFAHERGVLHRHIKPANILIHEDGTPKISDFRLAKSVVPRPGTGSGMAAGSAFYRAPEQLQGQQVDGRADQFALAVIAFEGLTGKRPFEADTPSALFQKILREPPPSPALLNPELPAGVETVLRRALAKEAGARYPSCSEFTQELRAALENRMLAAAATATAFPVVPEAALAPAADVTGTATGPTTTARLRKLLNRFIVASPVLVLAVLAGRFFYSRPAAAESPARASVPVAVLRAEAAPEPKPSPVVAAPAPASQMPEKIPASQYGRHPKLLQEVAPVYPTLARQARIQGIVRLKVLVGTNGRVHALSLVSGHPLLVPAALDAVRQWVYQRTVVNGEAGEVTTFVDVRFTLKI